MDLTLRDLFGARYERGGKTPGTYDCKSLFVEVQNRFGNAVQTPDIEILAVEQVLAAEARGEYAYTGTDSALIEQELASGKWEQLAVPEEGCAVLIALDLDKPNLVQHLGVCIEDGKFIHILQKMGVVVSRLADPFWRGKIRGYYRWKK